MISTQLFLFTLLASTTLSLPSTSSSSTSTLSTLLQHSISKSAPVTQQASAFDSILKNALGQVSGAKTNPYQLQYAMSFSTKHAPAKVASTRRKRYSTFTRNQRRSSKVVINQDVEKRGFTGGFKGIGLGPVIVPGLQYVLSSPPSVALATPVSATPTVVANPVTVELIASPVSTPTVTPVISSSTWPSSGGMIAAAYYPDWEGTTLPPSKINFELYDLIDFAFAIPTSDFNLQFGQDSSSDLLTELVKLAHESNTKVMLSIGGWSSSNFFSQAVSTEDNRIIFVNNIVKFSQSYNVDGVDIDWEYPGGSGAGNTYSGSDSSNFLAFLQLLKSSLATGQRISACVASETFLDSNGSPLVDVTAFSNVLDNILIMNYDTWGASSTPGANAPLSNGCSNSNQPNANEQSAINTWVSAGFKASKILMGVPSYGYISSSSATTLVHKKRSLASDGELNNRDRAKAAFTLAEVKVEKAFTMRRWYEQGQAKVVKRNLESKQLLRRKNSEIINRRSGVVFCANDHSKKPCGSSAIISQAINKINWNPVTGTTKLVNNLSGTNLVAHGVFSGTAGIGKLGDGSLTSISGNQVEFWQLISNGVLVEQNSEFVAVNGYTRVWDSCSSTPFLYDTARNVVITYDDPQSMILKGQVAKSNGIAGINMWDMSGDSLGSDLTRAYRNGMGLLNL